MKNNLHSSSAGQPEHNESTVQDVERGPSSVKNSEELLLLDYLLDQGFVWEEARKLVHLREHLYDNAEMQQRMAEDNRMQFIRWLYENGEIKEV